MKCTQPFVDHSRLDTERIQLIGLIVLVIADYKMTLEQDERVEAGQQERNQDQPPQRMNRGQQWLTHVSNQRTSLALAVFLFFVHLGLVIQRIYQYRQSSLAVIIARASGKPIQFHR